MQLTIVLGGLNIVPFTNTNAMSLMRVNLLPCT
jgi:hypothetical protein